LWINFGNLNDEAHYICSHVPASPRNETCSHDQLETCKSLSTMHVHILCTWNESLCGDWNETCVHGEVGFKDIGMLSYLEDE
jgi:hypothetical protein